MNWASKEDDDNDNDNDNDSCLFIFPDCLDKSCRAGKAVFFWACFHSWFLELEFSCTSRRVELARRSSHAKGIFP